MQASGAPGVAVEGTRRSQQNWWLDQVWTMTQRKGSRAPRALARAAVVTGTAVRLEPLQYPGGDVEIGVWTSGDEVWAGDTFASRWHFG